MTSLVWYIFERVDGAVSAFVNHCVARVEGLSKSRFSTQEIVIESFFTQYLGTSHSLFKE